jgi:putative ABC transport system permease protein
MIFIFSEISFDKFHPEYKNIFRVNTQGKFEGSGFNTAYSNIPCGPAFTEEIPELVAFTRMRTTGQRLLKYGENNLLEDKFVYADSGIFSIFKLDMIAGDPAKALSEPKTLVLTEKIAIKLFGNEDPLGKMISVNADTNMFRVTGIIHDLPNETHLDFNILASFISEPDANSDFWLANSLFTYVLAEPGASEEAMEQKMEEITFRNIEPQLQQIFGITAEDFKNSDDKYGYFLQPLSDVHLNTEITGGFKPAHERKYLWIFSFIALFIIVIASINFMNMSTARSASRAKEVGLRKVVGSTRSMLISQFMWESILMSFFSFIIALIIVELSLPYFNQIVDIELSVNYLKTWYTIPILLIITLFVGILSGSYPAFVLASFKPVDVLKGQLTKGVKGGWLRSTLVILQFSISILIIIGTIVIFSQLNYMLKKDLGFQKDRLIVLDRVWPLGNRIQTFIQELEKLPGVEMASNSTAYPGNSNNNNGYQIKGRDRAKTYLFITTFTDYKFLDVYGMQMASGRFFDRQFPSDSMVCVVNETALKRYAIEDPYNTIILQPDDQLSPQELRIIGVVKDFHQESLHTPIEPCIFLLKREWWTWGGYITVKLSENLKSTRPTLEQIEAKWQEFLPNEPLLYDFFDDNYRQLYSEEIRTGRLALIFSILAIIIASMGLFGLTMYTTEKRTKEIGIRKVMGASSGNIVLMITRNITLLVVIATVIAWAASYRIMMNWLEAFPYRINLSIWVFVLAALFALLLALVTVSLQAYRAAKANPAESLHSE